MRNRMIAFGLVSALAIAYASVAVSGSASGSAVPASSTSARPSAATARLHPALKPLPPPSHFQRHVTNRYMPLLPGMRWVYRGFGSEGRQRDVMTVLDRTKTIKGIRATVVRDIVHERGRLIERTFDWYAQDGLGRVWYLGERTKAFEGGHVSTEGSWQTGVHRARAGVVMFKHPRVGARYWQEFLRGHAEDQGKVVDLSTKVGVPAGHFRHVRMTEDTTRLEPRIVEFKFYAPGVGVVSEVDSSPHAGHVSLIKFSKP
jgi:hypothetical protein